MTKSRSRRHILATALCVALVGSAGLAEQLGIPVEIVGPWDPDLPKGLQVPPPGAVELVHWTIQDNGDGDGWADTNETVSIRLTLRNRTGRDLEALRVTLSTDDPTIDCLAASTVLVGDVANNAVVTPADPVVFQVGDVHRNSIDESLVASFLVSLTASDGVAIPERRLTLDLDLDVTGGAGPTTFFEGFEGGLGAFTTMHLDEDLNPPPSDLANAQLGLIKSDGYRCQYSDPDWEGSNTYNENANCYLNPNAATDAFSWTATNDRSFSGVGSLHWGVALDAFRGFTTMLAQLEGVRTTDPIGIGWGRVCSATRSTRCESALDCPIDEECVPAAPELALAQQVSLIDHSSGVGSQVGARAADRGWVQVQLADALGHGIGDWIKIHPYHNVYDSQTDTVFTQLCYFDPIDDGNTEEDFFDPADPGRRLGPSSSCAPEYNFVDQGDTFELFDESSIGDASDGPGLEGESGLGTWVQSRFSLVRFAGRRLRVRFLTSSLKWGGGVTWEGIFRHNPDPGDDGWFVDDVVLTDVLTTPADVLVDSGPNQDIRGDADLDGVAATCDCNPNDPEAWALPGEVRDLRVTRSDGEIRLQWSLPEDPGGPMPFFDVVRSSSAQGFADARRASCVSSGQVTQVSDSDAPASGDAAFYLIGARNDCGRGPLGPTSTGGSRSAIECR